MFKGFGHVDTRTKKMHSKVHLQKNITLITDEPCQYDLHACALHHGENLYNGHYTSLLFQDDSVVEIDDTHIKCVTEEWENRSTLTVYFAFYCKHQNSTFQMQDLVAEHIKISGTNNVKSKSIKSGIAKSLNFTTETNKFKVSNVSSEIQMSIIDETNKNLTQICAAMRNSKICNIKEFI